MTVAELIAELSVLPPETLVIVQKDAEGNEHSPLNGLGTEGHYEPHSTWAGCVHYDEDFEEDYHPEDKEDILSRCKPCVVLCPVN